MALPFFNAYRGSIGRFFQGDPTLVGYWQLDGNSLDNSGNGNNGTSSGIYYGPQYSNFRIKNGAYNPGGGGNNLITVPASASLMSPTNQLTVIGWINLFSILSNYQALVTMRLIPDASPWATYSLGVTSSGFFDFYTTTSSSSVSATDNIAITLKRWYCIAGVYDGSQMKLFVNGTLRASASQTGNLNYGSNRELRLLDNIPYYGQYYNGCGEEIAIFSRALSAQEISQYYQWAISYPRKTYYEVEELVPNTRRRLLLTM
jgi:hypothetical protein